MSNSSSSSYNDYLTQVNNDLNIYFTLASSIIGIPANLLSIAVFARLIVHQKSNMAFLYIVQCLCDLTFLVVTLFIVRGAGLVFGYQFYSMSDSWCKAWAFLRRYCLHVSSWMVALTAFDRFTFVLYENRRFKFMRDKRVLTLIIIAMFTFLAICNLGNFFYYNDPRAFGLSCVGDYVTAFATDIISILLRTYIPLSLMLVFNLFMLHKIFKSRKRVNSIRKTNNSSRKSGSSRKMSSISRKEQHFTFAVIAYDVIFFMSKFPLSVFYIVFDIYSYSGVFKTQLTLALYYNLLLNIFLSISLFDQIFSFFMNLAFNKIFRKELLRFIRCNPLNSESTLEHSLHHSSLNNKT